MIDTHAHLDALAADLDDILARARETGVRRIVTIGTGIGSSRRAIEIAERDDGVFAALGIDPHRAATPDAETIRQSAAVRCPRSPDSDRRCGPHLPRSG